MANGSGNKLILCPQSGCAFELGKLMDTAKLLVEMGYQVRRIKVARDGQKTLLNALEIMEQPAQGAEERGG